MNDPSETEIRTVTKVISACDPRPHLRVEIIRDCGQEFIEVVADYVSEEDRVRVPFYALSGLIAALSAARETEEPGEGL